MLASELSPYEQERHKRIQKNREIMISLGLLEIKEELKRCCEKNTSKKSHVKPRTKKQYEKCRSSTRISKITSMMNIDDEHSKIISEYDKNNRHLMKKESYFEEDVFHDEENLTYDIMNNQTACIYPTNFQQTTDTIHRTGCEDYSLCEIEDTSLPSEWKLQNPLIRSVSKSGYKYVHFTAQGTYQAQPYIQIGKKVKKLVHLGIFRNPKTASHIVSYVLQNSEKFKVMRPYQAKDYVLDYLTDIVTDNSYI